ncbi:MAG TPA: phosphoglycerate mutase family protein [Pyrinomonadaceae bacterium]|jgi:broad specificity phosphatase PhoE|nr:phosphoglycerate mutase family protein [Pyrinomonadaceae bacterium]
MTRKTLPLIAVLLLLSSFVFAQTAEPVTTVFLVRHSERAEEPRQDPPLTEQGVARSQALARLLSAAGIKAIYTSQFARTKLTAEPLAKQLNITATPISLKSNPTNPRQIAEESTKETVDKILSHAGGSVLVVGHSNSIPDVIKMLGGDVAPAIDEKKFDDLFVVTVYSKGKAKVAHLKYGAE